MAGLAICRYPDQAGFHWFGCDAEWQNVTDTRHETLETAQQQAEFEYEGVGGTWIFAEPGAPPPGGTAAPGDNVKPTPRPPSLS